MNPTLDPYAIDANQLAKVEADPEILEWLGAEIEDDLRDAIASLNSKFIGDYDSELKAGLDKGMPWVDQFGDARGLKFRFSSKAIRAVAELLANTAVEVRQFFGLGTAMEKRKINEYIDVSFYYAKDGTRGKRQGHKILFNLRNTIPLLKAVDNLLHLQNLAMTSDVPRSVMESQERIVSEAVKNLMNTAAHETYHQVAAAYGDLNREKYIPSEQDFDSYHRQYEERQARAFALRYVRGKVASAAA